MAPKSPLAYTTFSRRILRGIPPKWFSAITCAIWLRLIFRGRGSAWFFGAHLLFFHAWGRILEAGIRFWSPEVNILARGPFWPQQMSRKKLFCGGMILWWGFRGIHPAQMNSMVPRSHMGRLLCLQTPLKKISAHSPKSGKLVQALAHPCVFPIALRALVALFPLFGVYDGFIRVPNCLLYTSPSPRD